MEKKLLVLALASFLFADCMVQAQNYIVRAYADEEIPGIVKGVSENGEWAAGADGGVITYASFLWNKKAGRYKDIFGVKKDGTMGNSGLDCQAHLYDVSNDGIAVGCFEDGTNPLDATGKTAVRPGYYDYNTDKWTILPGLDGVEILEGKQNGWATKISPDGKIIAGCLPIRAGVMAPVIWIDGKPQRIDDLDYEGQGGFVTDMTDDGKVLVGFAEWEDGSRYPAVYKDGKRICFIGTEPATSKDSGWEYFYMGQMETISPDGKQVGGWFSNNGVTSDYGFLFDVPEKLEENMFVKEAEVQKIDFDVTHISKSGKIFGAKGSFGPVKIKENDNIYEFNTYFGKDKYDPTAIFDGNDTETTFASTIVVSFADSYANSPLVLTVEESTGINESETSGMVINKAGTTLNVYGYHTSVEIYDMSGNCVLKDKTGETTFDLSSYPKGIYVVKATNESHVETAKISL